MFSQWEIEQCSEWTWRGSVVMKPNEYGARVTGVESWRLPACTLLVSAILHGMVSITIGVYNFGHVHLAIGISKPD